MTDAKVTINGRKAGNGLHQGGFYRFTYDVSDRIFFGKHKNRLEVEVSKESSNSQVNMAERRADYWNFGGIFRPVFIVAKPAENIDRVAIDAKGDGHFMADCYLNRAVKGAKVKTEILDGKGKVVASNVLMPETAMRHMSTSRRRHLSCGLLRLTSLVLPFHTPGCSRQDAPQRASEVRLPHHRIPCQRWRLYQWSESHLQRCEPSQLPS